jgi:catechol 2,3-dioxygenase-like lactoylglutathione lyase family enzyme
MDAKVAQVTLVVQDQTAALEFYTRKVGFEKKTDVTPPGGYRWVTVGPTGESLEFALWARGTPVAPEQQKRAQEWASGKLPPIVLRVSNCRATYEELHGRGVHFFQPPVEQPWGTSATFEDPDGNLFSINQLPGSR